MPQVSEHQIETWFTFPAPTAAQAAKYEAIRVAAKELALEIFRNTTQGEDQIVALMKVRESVLLANQTIALAGISAHA